MFERSIKTQLNVALTDTPVVLIIGARQVGKTTLSRSFENNNYLTFDDVNTLSAARNSPKDFVANLTKPAIIDEIQLCPEILPAIKQSVDNDRAAGQFILTGSANVLTLPKVSESLAGRVELITLRTLSQNEIDGTNTNLVDKLFANELDFPTNFPEEDREKFLTRMLIGGYPEVLSRTDEARLIDWFASYLTTILQRDVRDLANIEGLIEMPRLLSLLASRAAGLLNIAEVSRSIAYSQMTINRYMSLLERVFLIEKVPAWSGSLKTRLVKAPKIYITDSGLLAYLNGLNIQKLTNEPALTGSLTENFVVNEVQKHVGWSKTKAEMFHFRTSNDREVDIVLENRAGDLIGIEVKSSSSVNKNDFKGLETLAESLPKKFKRGIILYSGNQFLSFGKDQFVVPISALWTAL